MVYSRYGEIFHDLRDEREIPMTDFASLGINKSMISRFETGKAMLKFDVLDEAMQLMGVSLHEYGFLLNNGQNDTFVELFEEIEQAIYLEDVPKLKSIFEENIKYKESRLIALSAKACYGTLTEAEQEEVGDYLFRIEHWGAYELYVFMNTIDQLNDELVHSLLKDFLVRSSYYKAIPDYNRLIIQAAINVVATLIERKNREASVFIINEVEKSLFEIDEYARTLMLFIRGYWFYVFEDKEYGKQRMQKTLEIFEVLNCQHLLKKYQKMYEKIVGKEK